MLGKHDTLTCFPNRAFPYPIKLYGVPTICITHVASLLSDFSKKFESQNFILNYQKVRLQCNNNSRNSFNVLALSLHSTTKNELLSKVCFYGSSEEDGASFGVVASKTMRVNGVEELEQEWYCRKKRIDFMWEKMEDWHECKSGKCNTSVYWAIGYYSQGVVCME